MFYGRILFSCIFNVNYLTLFWWIQIIVLCLLCVFGRPYFCPVLYTFCGISSFNPHLVSVYQEFQVSTKIGQ